MKFSINTLPAISKAISLKLLISIVALFLSFHTPPVLAGDDGDFGQTTRHLCSKGGQIEINICMTKEYKKIDAEMTNVYSKLVNTLKSPEGMIQSQKAWTRYRDAECSNKVFQIGTQGSLYPSMKAACLIDFTEGRIKRLQWHLAQTCNGCPPRKNN